MAYSFSLNGSSGPKDCPNKAIPGQSRCPDCAAHAGNSGIFEFSLYYNEPKKGHLAQEKAECYEAVRALPKSQSAREHRH